MTVWNPEDLDQKIEKKSASMQSIEFKNEEFAETILEYINRDGILQGIKNYFVNIE